MNNKLTDYKQAVENLKELELKQCRAKGRLLHMTDIVSRAFLQETIHCLKIEINKALSLVIAHKQARKYYGKLQDLKKNL